MHTELPTVGTCLRGGWQLYLREPGLLTLATLLVGLMNGLAGWIPFANLLVGPPLLGSLYLMVMRVNTGESVGFNNLFDGFEHFLPLVIASLLVSVIVGIGVFLLVIPGLYFAVAYGLTTLLIVDRQMSFWQAMETSRLTLTSVFGRYLLLALALIAILVAGSVPFGLGLLVAVPVCIAAQLRFYQGIVNNDALIEHASLRDNAV